MKILWAELDRLKLHLSPMEMDALTLDEEGRIDCTDPDTRAILLVLLEQAKGESVFAPGGRSRLVVEHTADGQGGGYVTFTLSRAAEKRAGIQPVIFQFEDAAGLIRGATMLYRRYGHRVRKSSLYSWERAYRLVLYPLDYTDRLSVYFLSEFADRVGEGDVLAAFVAEHGSPIVEDNAIETLARYFPEEENAGSGLDSNPEADA